MAIDRLEDNESHHRILQYFFLKSDKQSYCGIVLQNYQNFHILEKICILTVFILIKYAITLIFILIKYAYFLKPLCLKAFIHQYFTYITSIFIAHGTWASIYLKAHFLIKLYTTFITFYDF